MVSVVIHTNLALPNQRECAGWLQQGFEQHGIKAEITADRFKSADVHVVQGPWYCYDLYREKSDSERVLWLNRCHYGHPRYDISLGWLRPDGGRDFRNRSMADGKGVLPPLKAKKDSRRCAVVFPSYGEDAAEMVAYARQNYAAVWVRLHPQETRNTTKAMSLNDCPLEQVFSIGDVAVGHSSTVLVDARINGLHIDCSDPLNPVCDDPEDDDLWIKRLSWANWNYRELMNGDFWEHLK